MPRITRQTIDRIREAADILGVVGDFLPLEKKGNEYFARCPFHGEKTASFSINTGRNRYHCFGCGADGDSIQFLMEARGMSFNDALEYLAKKYSIEIRYENKEETEEEKNRYARNEELLNVLNYVQEFFVNSFNIYQEGKEYAFSRWNEKFVLEYGIGYAPRGNKDFFDFIKRRGIEEKDLIELGILSVNLDKGTKYCYFQERITIPIRNRWGKIIGFTARYIGEKADVAKYLNSRNSDIFNKSEIVFGLSDAAKAARIKNRFFLVEGGPDVLKLQSLGLFETVGALGTAWNREHFKQLSKISNKVCFIPDSEPPKGDNKFGAGFMAVMKAGALALDMGFDVTVRELPAEPGMKADPDSYIDSKETLLDIEDQNFIMWYARKLFRDPEGNKLAMSIAEEREAVKIISGLVASVDDAYTKKYVTLALPNIFRKAKDWKDWIEEASRKRKAEAEEADIKNFDEEEKARRNAGILIKNGQYYVTGEKDIERICNFVMTPIFHIKSNDNATRIYRIRNAYGDEDAIELTQEEMVSLPKFKKRIENLGRFIFLAKAEQLDKMKEYLYSITKTCEQITQMGYNAEHDFYAFGNGIFAGDRFRPVNDLGLVNIDGKNFYLPAFSDMHRHNKQYFSFELDFIHKPESNITLNEFASKLIDVFGDNAKVGFAFLIASVFRDIVYAVKDCFPILNLFGPPNSGKTALGTALMALFHPVQEPSKIASTTVPSMNMMLSRVSNAVEILDEYKNEIDFRRMEILKGVWGGKGQTKMNIEIKRIEDTVINAALILCGQEMPTKDPALFQRVIHLHFSRTEFSLEEKRRYNELKELTHMRNSHLLIEILKLRSKFKEHFVEVYNATLSEMMSRLEGMIIKDRILDNWIVPLAAFRTIETLIDAPFTYKELFEITIKKLKAQNEMVKRKSELADFWKLFASLYMNGRIVDKAHFRIKAEKQFKPSKGKQVNFDSPKMILYVNYASVEQVISARAGMGGTASRLDLPTLQPYLEMSAHYIGRKQMRMAKLNALGNIESESTGNISSNLESIAYVMAFDYQMLKDEFEISLETFREGLDPDLEEPEEIIEQKSTFDNPDKRMLVSDIIREMEEEKNGK